MLQIEAVKVRTMVVTLDLDDTADMLPVPKQAFFSRIDPVGADVENPDICHGEHQDLAS